MSRFVKIGTFFLQKINKHYMKKTFYSLALALLMASCASQPKQELYENLKAQLYASRKNDLITGSTSVGPHRDDLDIKIDSMISKYGPAITGEALEEAVQNLPDIDNPALYYRTSDEETNDMQDEYFDKLEDQLDRLADNLQEEEQRIADEQAREEERRRQEQENRERAREQAERARETEQKYKQMEEQPKQPSGIFGKVRSFIRGLFRRGR